jgi:cell division transport system permease protein
MRVSHVLQELGRNVRRHGGSFAVAVSVQAVCFILFALFSVTTLNLARVAAAARQALEVHVFLADGTDPEPVSVRIASLAGVSATRFVSRDEAQAELAAELGEDAALLDVLDENPLPPSIRVTLAPGSVSPEGLAEVEAKLGLLPGVVEVWSGSESLARLDRVLRFAIGLAIALLLVVSVAAAFIAFQTVEGSIAARTREMEIMDLVGASPAMVRAPFVLEGALQGLLGGAAAFLLVALFVRLAAIVFPGLVFPAPTVAAAVHGLGAGLGLLGAALAIGRTRR